MIDATEWTNLSAVVHTAAKNAGVEFRGLNQDDNGQWYLLYIKNRRKATMVFTHSWQAESYHALRDRLTIDLANAT